MATARWHTDTTSTPHRLIAYYDPSDEPPRAIRQNAVYGNVKQPYLVQTGMEHHLNVTTGTHLAAVKESQYWTLRRGFPVSVDPATDDTYAITDLVGEPQFTTDIFTGYKNGVTYPIDHRVVSTIYDPAGVLTYFGLDATRQSLFANYFLGQPRVVGADGTNRGDVLSAVGMQGGSDWARLLSHLPFSPSLYQSRGAVIDRGDGVERARAIRWGTDRSSLSTGVVMPATSPQSLYVGTPSGFYMRHGSNNGMNTLHMGLPPSVKILWTMTQNLTDPAPEWRAKLQLWSPTTSLYSPAETSLGSGTMELDGTAGSTKYYYHQETYDLSGYDISGRILFQVLAEAKPGYSPYWSIGNAHPWHKMPCGWPLWAIGERPEYEVPFIPAPLFKRA